MDAFLKINEGDIETEHVASKPSNPFNRIGGVTQPKGKVHDHGPEADPRHEGKVRSGAVSNDVIDGAGRMLESSSIRWVTRTCELNMVMGPVTPTMTSG